jgi:hypothetical protein
MGRLLIVADHLDRAAAHRPSRRRGFLFSVENTGKMPPKLAVSF